MFQFLFKKNPYYRKGMEDRPVDIYMARLLFGQDIRTVMSIIVFVILVVVCYRALKPIDHNLVKQSINSFVRNVNFYLPNN